jgi:uncharacterized protein
MSPVTARSSSASSPTAPLPPHGGPDVRRRRPHALLTTAALLLAGASAAGAGAALGIRYAQKTGLSVTTILGFCLLGAGVVGLGLALHRLWASLHRWYRLVLAPVMVVLLMAAGSVGLAVAYTQVPPVELGSASPTDRGLQYTDVEFATGDGAVLSGWLVPSRNSAAVVLLHGAGSTRTATLDQAAVIARHGFGVLLFDARGHGRSSGTGMDLGWFGDRDVVAAVGYLQDEVGIAPERIGLVGMSMGGEQAIGAAVPTGVRAVVAEGATARTAADKDQWLPGGVSGVVQRAWDALTFSVTELLTPAPEPIALHEAVRTAERTRFLLVTGGDMPDEARAATALDAAAPGRVDVWTVPGAGHTGGLDRHPADWEQRVVGFLERQLT